MERKNIKRWTARDRKIEKREKDGKEKYKEVDNEREKDRKREKDGKEKYKEGKRERKIEKKEGWKGKI